MAIQDVIVITVMIFAAVITGIMVTQVWFSISGPLRTALDTADNTTQSDEIIVSTNVAINGMDGVLMFIMIGSAMAIIGLAYFVPSHPIFYAFMILIALVVFVVAPTFANAFVNVATSSSLSTAAIETRWPMTTFLMQRYPIYVLVTAAGVIIALFAKPRE